MPALLRVAEMFAIDPRSCLSSRSLSLLQVTRHLYSTHRAMFGPRRNIREMPYDRRHLGMCALERLKEFNTWILAIVFLGMSMALPPSIGAAALYYTAILLIAIASNARVVIWDIIDPIDKSNRDRGIQSFSEKDCWRHLRFRKEDLPELLRLSEMPGYIDCGTVDKPFLVRGEYAFLLFLYRSHYPSTLSLLQTTFGRDYSQLSRIYTATVEYLDRIHRHKVVGNIGWYRSRFDLYHFTILCAMANSAFNPVPGTIPVYLSNIFGFIDGTCRPISRPFQNNNAQFPMWNGYYHTHCMIFLGLCFPDGLVVLEPPFPGYFTDTMCWRDCVLRHQLDEIMAERLLQNLILLKLYGDKIFVTCDLITAAFSLRNGPLAPWMTALNRLMSPIRVSIEWCYGKVIARSKFVDYRQKIRESPVVKAYYLATLFANAHTCLYGSQHTTAFGLNAPSVQEYFAQ